VCQLRADLVMQRRSVRTIECDVRQKEVLCPTHNWSLRLALSEP